MGAKLVRPWAWSLEETLALLWVRQLGAKLALLWVCGGSTHTTGHRSLCRIPYHPRPCTKRGTRNTDRQYFRIACAGSPMQHYTPWLKVQESEISSNIRS